MNKDFFISKTLQKMNPRDMCVPKRALDLGQPCRALIGGCTLSL